MNFKVSLSELLMIASFSVHGHTYLKEKPHPKDTLYYISFLDLIEIGFDDKKFRTDLDLTDEREVMNKVLKGKLQEKFLLLPLPEKCYKEFSIDSITRRTPEFMQKVCETCQIEKRVILMDAVWKYLNDGVYRGMQYKHHTRGIGESPWDIGTWWDIRGRIYSPVEDKLIFRTHWKFTQFGHRRPTKGLPGISHKRFFKRPIKRLREFLEKPIENKK